MNDDHKCACSSPEWRATVRDQIIPWVLDGIDLGDDVLELGPGFGATTDVLCERAPRLTAVEIDDQMADDLQRHFTGTNVTILQGDATRLDLDDRRFSAVLSFSMLHHVQSPELQDRLFSEARRVLRDGGVFAATDSLPSEGLREFHHDDIYMPIDPAELPDRLGAAGFADLDIQLNDYAWKVRARAAG
jgi:SAM-dependent methyltransferase